MRSLQWRHTTPFATLWDSTPVTSLIAISPFFLFQFFSFLSCSCTSPDRFSSIVFCPLFSCHPVIMWARWTKQGKEPRWRRKKSFCIFKSARWARRIERVSFWTGWLEERRERERERERKGLRELSIWGEKEREGERWR